MRYFFLILLACLPLFLSHSLLFLKDPPIWPDEAVFYSMAETFTQQGEIRTDIWDDMFPEFKIYGSYPPMYFYTLSFWTRLFGSSIESIRVLSTSLAVISLALFFLLIKQLLNNNFLAVLGTAALSINPYFASSARTGRMEMLVLMFTVLAALLTAMALKRHRWLLYILASISATLATLSHTMGFLAPLSLGLYTLLASKKIKEKAIMAGILVASVILIYGGWLISLGDKISSYLKSYQIFASAKANTEIFILSLFGKDFSWALTFTTYIIIILSFIYICAKNFSDNHKLILSMIVASVFFIHFGKENAYTLYAIPPIILALLCLINYAKSKSPILERGWYGAAFLMIFLSIYLQFFHNPAISINSPANHSISAAKNFDYYKFAFSIADKLPKDKQLTVFISSVPDPYFVLKKLPNLKLIESYNPPYITHESYKNAMDKSDYVIFTWAPYPYLLDYIEANAESIMQIGEEGEYSARLIKFVDRAKRI